MLDSLLFGMTEPYIKNTEEIQRHFDGRTDKSISLNFHKNRLFDRQNLYYLSIMNSQKEFDGSSLPDKRYAGLLDKSKRELIFQPKRKQEKKEEGKVAVLSVVDKCYEKWHLRYYESMLKFAGNSRCDIYLSCDDECYRLSLREDGSAGMEKIVQYGKFTEIVRQEAYDRYVILPASSIVHHCFLDTIEMEKSSYYVTFDESVLMSFSLSSEELRFFAGGDSLQKYSGFKELISGLSRELTDYVDLPSSSFGRQKQGILSLEGVEVESVGLLLNFNYTVLELQDIEKSLEYMISIYSDSRIADLVTIHTGDIAMTLIKPLGIKESEEDIACILVERNEYLRMEGFLEYYRGMGVNKFYIIDNASDDGKTVDFLLDQDDVELYSTVQAYSQSNYGIKWAEALIHAKRAGKWTLVVDADELLLLDKGFDTIQALCRHLEAEGSDSLYTAFIDMYSKSSIDKTLYAKGGNILESCGYYDKHFYTSYSTKGGIKGDMMTYMGGVRSRVFGLDGVIINKVPLFKYHPSHKLREGLHWIDNATPAYAQAVLLHFKYIETFHRYVEDEIKRGQHWDGASEYQYYHKALEKNPDFSLYDPTLSRKFISVEDFYKNMFSPFTLKEEMKNV